MASLPSYVAAAKPVPPSARIPWYSGIAPTYAGVMVWYAFWQGVPGYGGTPGGVLSQGVGIALVGVVVAALVCYFLFYLVPGLLGMKNGLPLYVVGTSTYGVTGGLLMPGLLMGVLQFFWLGFNAFVVSKTLCQCFEIGVVDAKGVPVVPGAWHGAIAVVFAAAAAFMGLKGIQYVAKVATYLPLIPIAVLVLLFVTTMGGLRDFTPEQVTQAKAPATKSDDKANDGGETAAKDKAAPAEGEAKKADAAKESKPKDPLSTLMVFLAVNACIVGFFATAGAAGADIAMNARDEKHVQIGGLVGIAAATIFSCALAILIVAGAYGAKLVPASMMGNLNPIDLMKGTKEAEGLLSGRTANILMILLAISSFPPACFSAFIAANSFRTTLPKVNPFVSVGLGTFVAIVLAVTGWAGDAERVFGIIGASFGPVCGAMAADYLLSGRKWAGPRAGLNLAGWISWVVGFAVGIVNGLPVPEQFQQVPCPPVAAFVVGFVLYIVLAKAGLESRTLEMPRAAR